MPTRANAIHPLHSVPPPILKSSLVASKPGLDAIRDGYLRPYKGGTKDLCNYHLDHYLRWCESVDLVCAFHPSRNTARASASERCTWGLTVRFSARQAEAATAGRIGSPIHAPASLHLPQVRPPTDRLTADAPRIGGSWVCFALINGNLSALVAVAFFALLATAWPLGDARRAASTFSDLEENL